MSRHLRFFRRLARALFPEGFLTDSESEMTRGVPARVDPSTALRGE